MEWLALVERSGTSLSRAGGDLKLEGGELALGLRLGSRRGEGFVPQRAGRRQNGESRIASMEIKFQIFVWFASDSEDKKGSYEPPKSPC